jgi:PAS domain S-box-containing protein
MSAARETASSVWHDASMAADRLATVEELPQSRGAFWVRVAAYLTMATVFVVDLVTPTGIAVPALYVAPTLLFIAAGQPWDPLVVAAGSTLLIAIGVQLGPPGAYTEAGALIRAFEASLVWISALLVSQYRRSIAAWTARNEAIRLAREESVRRLEEMRQALDQAAIVATTDQRGLITYVNDKFCEISKYPREELLGQDHRIINSGYHPQEFIRDLWRTIASGQIWRGELRNRAKDGSIYWVDTTIVPFLNDAGKPRQYLAIRSDITKRKRAEQQLADQAALTQLGQLAAVVAHEVRNPLAGVKGSLQILSSRAVEGSQDRQIIDAMIARLDGLNAKVEDILRFARPRTPTFESVDAGAVIADVLASAAADVGPSCPAIEGPEGTAIVRADREMFRELLLNLVLNACQSGTTEPVKVTLDASVGTCHISIMDRGVGIAPIDAERIFEPFYTTKKTGTGLGLAIVRRSVDLQGGTIALSARHGGGTIVQLTFPLAAAPGEAERRVAQVAGRSNAIP